MTIEKRSEKDLNELKEQILKEGNTLVDKQDLPERFVEIDNEYKHRPWNLLQILANMDILIGEKPCEDCISRQAVRQALDRYIQKAQSTGTIDDLISFEELVVKSLPSVRPKTEWIPVSERLPEEGEEVLVWYEYFRYGTYNGIWPAYGIGWQYDNHFSVDNGGAKQRVIAWQPLPKPYKAESEVEE